MTTPKSPSLWAALQANFAPAEVDLSDLPAESPADRGQGTSAQPQTDNPDKRGSSAVDRAISLVDRASQTTKRAPVIGCNGTRQQADPAPLRPRRSSRRSRTLAAQIGNRRRGAQAGNVNAWRHGVFAEAGNLADVAVEVELVYVAHPGLDRGRDSRLVELYATSAVIHRRAVLAMVSGDVPESVSALVRQLAPLLERLEIRLDEREAARLRQAAPDPLASYRRS